MSYNHGISLKVQSCYLYVVAHGGDRPDRANFFFGRTFDLPVVSAKSINYACAVKNDTPIMCTVGSLVQTGYEH